VSPDLKVQFQPGGTFFVGPEKYPIQVYHAVVVEALLQSGLKPWPVGKVEQIREFAPLEVILAHTENRPDQTVGFYDP
jgi:hypothetical protein